MTPLKPTHRCKMLQKCCSSKNIYLNKIPLNCMSDCDPRSQTTPSRRRRSSSGTRHWRRSCWSGSRRPSASSATRSLPTRSPACSSNSRPSLRTAPSRSLSSTSCLRDDSETPEKCVLDASETFVRCFHDSCKVFLRDLYDVSKRPV